MPGSIDPYPMSQAWDPIPYLLWRSPHVWDLAMEGQRVQDELMSLLTN